MAEEIKIGDDKEVTPPLEEKKEVPKEVPKAPEENPEVKAKAEELSNLNKAIQAEQERLHKIRKEIKQVKKLVSDEEEELPKIDLDDPSAKAWDKRIRESVAPAQQELERAKEERRLYALKQFLSDKPSLSKNPEKVKAMMETYDRLKTSTELTGEGILMDLQKAYAAEHYDELISSVQQSRIDNARNDAIFSDIAVSRGSTAYSSEKQKQRVYSEGEKAQLAKWGMTPAEHAKLIEEQNKKQAEVG